MGTSQLLSVPYALSAGGGVNFPTTILNPKAGCIEMWDYAKSDFANRIFE